MWQMALGAAAGLMQAYGANKTAKQQQALFSPGQLNNRAGQMYPWLRSALGQSGWREYMNKIANDPEYMDPAMMSRSYMENDRAGQSAYNRLLASQGRSGMRGGVGTALKMGFLGMTGMNRGRIAQEYAKYKSGLGMQRAQFLQGGWQNALSAAMGGAQQTSQFPGMDWSSIIGNGIQGGLANFTAKPQGYAPTQPSVTDYYQNPEGYQSYPAGSR